MPHCTTHTREPHCHVLTGLTLSNVLANCWSHFSLRCSFGLGRLRMAVTTRVVLGIEIRLVELIDHEDWKNILKLACWLLRTLLRLLSRAPQLSQIIEFSLRVVRVWHSVEVQGCGIALSICTSESSGSYPQHRTVLYWRSYFIVLQDARVCLR